MNITRRSALFLLPGAAALAQITSRQSHAVSRLTSEIERALVAGRIPSAAVALVEGDQIVWSAGFGYSNIWARTPATTDTVYLIGSTFKTMSTLALLQQMEQGKFKLDDPVNSYLKDFKIRGQSADQITFRHLLTHTSGIPAAFGPHSLWGDSAVKPLTEFLRESLEVKRPPLEKEEYSNLAFSLVAYMVQLFSGVPFREYMDKNIFKPLDMTSTAFEPTPDIDERMAMPYLVQPNTGALMPAIKLRADVWPAGLVYGTVLDQANWMILNLNGGVFRGKRLIAEKTLDTMFVRQYDRFKGPVEQMWGSENAGFGLTWWVDQRDGRHYFAHSGSVPGYTAFLQGWREKKLGIAILTNGNRAHPHLIQLADKAMNLLAE